MTIKTTVLRLRNCRSTSPRPRARGNEKAKLSYIREATLNHNKGKSFTCYIELSSAEGGDYWGCREQACRENENNSIPPILRRNESGRGPRGFKKCGEIQFGMRGTPGPCSLRVSPSRATMTSTDTVQRCVLSLKRWA